MNHHTLFPLHPPLMNLDSPWQRMSSKRNGQHIFVVSQHRVFLAKVMFSCGAPAFSTLRHIYLIMFEEVGRRKWYWGWQNKVETPICCFCLTWRSLLVPVA